MKFKKGQKVKVVKIIDAGTELDEYIGRIGKVVETEPDDDYQYNILFKENDLEELEWFKEEELRLYQYQTKIDKLKKRLRCK